MQNQPSQQSSAESRPRPTQTLHEGLPDLGELVPVDSFFSRYMDVLGMTNKSAPGAEGSGLAQSQAGNYPGPKVQSSSGPMQQLQPNFRYGSTPNYLAQLTGHDQHNSQARSNLPVEQLDTGLQHRQLLAQAGFQGPGMPPPHGAGAGPQPDVLTYPSSSLAHFQQMLQAQAGSLHGLGTSLPSSVAPMQSLSQPMLQALQQAHHWQPPKPASGKSNRDPHQSNHNLNIDSSQSMLSPRYQSGSRVPNASTSSPGSRAKPQEMQPASRGPPGSRGDQSEIEMEDEGQSAGSRLPSGALGRTNRTPRQQLQNKQAQQRYRERRKMKVTEMEQALAAMSQQVDELQGVLKQNVALQDKSLRLEHMLSEKDAKIEQLTSQLKAAASGQASSSAIPDQDPGPGAGQSEEGRKQGTSTLDGMSHLKLEFQGQIMKLQQWIEANNLKNADPFGGGVPAGVMDHLTEMVEDGLRVCRKVQAEGIQVLQLITHSPNSLDDAATAQERNKWNDVVRGVKLTSLQTEQLLMWREEHLRNMHAIYDQRQQLNIQAVQKMMPGAELAPQQQVNSQRLVEAMEKEGYLPTARANLELTDALEKIKENLKFEQRSVLQFNWVLVHRILSPIQVALFMVQAWPSHCDCLAFVNAAHRLRDELMGGASAVPASSIPQQSALQVPLSEPMDVDPNPHLHSHSQASLLPGVPPGLLGLPQPPGSEAGVSSGQQAGPSLVAPQATPFASAFRPVVPTRRDAAAPRSFLPAAQPSTGPFQTAPNPSRGSVGQGVPSSGPPQTFQGPVVSPAPKRGSPGQVPQPGGAPQGPFQTSPGPSRGSSIQDPAAAAASLGRPSSSTAKAGPHLPAIPSVPSSQPSSATHVQDASPKKGNLSGSDSVESQGSPGRAATPSAQARQASPQQSN